MLMKAMKKRRTSGSLKFIDCFGTVFDLASNKPRLLTPAVPLTDCSLSEGRDAHGNTGLNNNDFEIIFLYDFD